MTFIFLCGLPSDADCKEVLEYQCGEVRMW